jgi:AhpD family alkylhydroperoxidase
MCGFCTHRKSQITDDWSLLTDYRSLYAEEHQLHCSLTIRRTTTNPSPFTPMTTDVTGFFEHWPAARQKLKDQAPEIARGFGGFYQSVMKEGALSVREKELIAMAIGLTQRCEPCINLHTQGCVKAGATREQILEAAGVAVMMQGGPAYTHVPEVIAALEHLRKGPAS